MKQNPSSAMRNMALSAGIGLIIVSPAFAETTDNVLLCTVENKNSGEETAWRFEPIGHPNALAEKWVKRSGGNRLVWDDVGRPIWTVSYLKNHVLLRSTTDPSYALGIESPSGPDLPNRAVLFKGTDALAQGVCTMIAGQ